MISRVIPTLYLCRKFKEETRNCVAQEGNFALNTSSFRTFRSFCSLKQNVHGNLLDQPEKLLAAYNRNSDVDSKHLFLSQNEASRVHGPRARNAICTQAPPVFLFSCLLASCPLILRWLPQLQASHLCRPEAKGRRQEQLGRGFSLCLFEDTSPSPQLSPVVFLLGLFGQMGPMCTPKPFPGDEDRDW